MLLVASPLSFTLSAAVQSQAAICTLSVRARGDDRGVKEHPIFARLYDRITAAQERRVLGPLREQLLAEASGRTLELGAGTGHNLPFYPERVSALVLIEPEPNMARRLRARLAEHPPKPESVSVVEAPSEELPFEDQSFDTVVATLVLCTVDDPRRALAEARRVLVEGGALLFLEHVRSSRPWLARWQDRLERPWGLIAGGCHPNRPTGDTLAESGFWIERMERDHLPNPVPIVRPTIRGLARRPTAAPRE
jgi:ubiquinone/menaquinone biosynthesis C-methylase UbiE